MHTPQPFPTINTPRQLPSVEQLLKMPSFVLAMAQHGREPTLKAIRESLAEYRQALQNSPQTPLDIAGLTAHINQRLQQQTQPRCRTLINLTGTVIHTNFGRALLPHSAIDAIVRACAMPCNLEYDLSQGKRGERDDWVNELLCTLTGAESATVVNNNAAGVFLLLNALALKKQVIVSRGELIEIGGAFRIPDIMQRAGAKLIEVGTTNRTHLTDYARAINSRTAMIMKVHTSNYAVQGFTHTVSEAELAQLAHEHQLPFVVDLGSGTLVDLEQYGLPHEPTAQQALRAGADLVCFSGDKLLGGPQAGMIVGKKSLIEIIRKNPLKRALRVGKITMSALSAVLQLYQRPETLHQTLPILRDLARSQAEIRAFATLLYPQVQNILESKHWPIRLELIEVASQIGSGALPIENLPSFALAFLPLRAKDKSVIHRLESALRQLPTPIIGRINSGRLIGDLRCLYDADAFLSSLSALAEYA